MFFSSKIKKFKNLRHCFFSRNNGVSNGYYKSLNCGIGSNDKKKMFYKTSNWLVKKLDAIKNL